MLASAKLMAFVATANAAEAQRFYAGVLGLRLVEDTPFALVFASVSPMPFTVLGWEVGDIGEAVKALTAAGITFERYEGISQDELGIWQSPDNASIAWFKDPDGNQLSLAQFGV
jgi:catechol 2,3-dioxygenase-like lactoylglutathione lyase family enzyme